jgi:hypothetical protein
MTDPELLRRVDTALALLAAWLALTVLLACFAMMLVDLVVGVLALATVLLVTLVGARSYLRVGSPPAPQSETLRRQAGR